MNDDDDDEACPTFTLFVYFSQINGTMFVIYLIQIYFLLTFIYHCNLFILKKSPNFKILFQSDLFYYSYYILIIF